MTTWPYTALPVKEFFGEKKKTSWSCRSCNALLAHQISLRNFFLLPSGKIIAEVSEDHILKPWIAVDEG
jgi:hypothetical protein